MSSRVTDWPTPDEKLAALHHKLIAAVEQLTTSEAWLRMLQVAARFPDYSGGGGRIIELRECRRAPAVSQRLKLLWRHRQVE